MDKAAKIENLVMDYAQNMDFDDLLQFYIDTKTEIFEGYSESQIDELLSESSIVYR